MDGNKVPIKLEMESVMIKMEERALNGYGDIAGSHAKERLLSCDRCDKIFSCDKEFLIHLRTH